MSVDVEGVPSEIKVKECPDALRECALMAAWTWRFHPYRIDGTAQPSTCVLKIQFEE